MLSACERRVAGFQRPAQSARNAGANICTAGTAAGAPLRLGISEQGQKFHAPTPRALQAVVKTGVSALRGSVEEVRFSTLSGGLFTRPTHLIGR